MTDFFDERNSYSNSPADNAADGARNTMKISEFHKILLTRPTLCDSQGIDLVHTDVLSVLIVRSDANLAVTATKLTAPDRTTPIAGILHVFESDDNSKALDAEVSNPLCLELWFSNQEEISKLIEILELLRAHMGKNGTDNEPRTN